MTSESSSEPYMKTSALVFRLLMLLWVMTGVTTAARQGPPPASAVPVEPIPAIVEAFRSHAVVALGDDHGNEQDHAFRLSLIRDRKFEATVNDIVVEFGNARYQDLMDRFVHGEEVPYESLRQVWLNTTQPVQEWAFPVYEEFFRAVRMVNASLPREHQLRVL